VTFAVAMLAGFGTAALRSRIGARHWPAAAALLVGVAAVEPLAAPLGLQHFDGIAPIYARLPHAADTVAIELPFPGARSVQFNAHYMLNATEHWQPIVNGYSGLQPPSYYRNAEALQQFPDDRSIARLRTLGVTQVFVHEDQMSDQALETLRGQTALVAEDRFGAIVRYRLTR
jgi:hypothetical protein